MATGQRAQTTPGTMNNKDGRGGNEVGSSSHSSDDSVAAKATITQLLAENAALKRQIISERRLRKEAEDIIDLRQDEIVENDARLQQLLAEMQNMRQNRTPAGTGTRHSVDGTRSDRRSQIGQLPADIISKPSPAVSRHNEISDDEATDAYIALINNVRRTVTDLLKAVLDDFYRGKLTPRPRANEALFSLTRQRARLFFGLAQSENVHFFAIVMEFLRLRIFSLPFYGLGKGMRLGSFLESTDSFFASMAWFSNSPQQGREWQADLLSKLTSSRTFRDLRRKYIRALSMELAELLAPLTSPVLAGRAAPAEPVSKLADTLSNDVIEPAINLAHSLHVATKVYEIKWVEHKDHSPSLSDCEAVEVDYKRISFVNDDSPYSFLFDINPGLFVQDLGNGKPQPVFAQGVILQHGEIQTKRTFVQYLFEDYTSPNPQKRTSWKVFK